MKRNFWWLAWVAMIAGAAWALDPPRPASPATGPAAQQSSAPEPAAIPAEAPPAPAAVPAEAPPAPAAVPAEAPPATTAAPAEEDELPPPPPPTGQTGPTPQRFDPSEEVRADFPVSFPADI